MQDLAKRNEANRRDPAVGETVFVGGACNCRGIVTEIVKKYDQISYVIDLENGHTSRRFRKEFVRVRQ